MTDDASSEAAGASAGGATPLVPEATPAVPAFEIRKVAPPTAQERQTRRDAMESAIKFGAAPYRDAEGKARYVSFREANNAPVEAWKRDREAKRGYRRTQYARKAAGQMVWHPEDQIELGKRLGVIYHREGRSVEGAAERGLYDAIWRYEHVWDSFTVPRRFGRDIIETGRIAAVAEEEGRKLQAEDLKAVGGFWVRDRKNNGLIYVVPNPDPNAPAEDSLVAGEGDDSVIGMADPGGITRSVLDIVPEVYDPAGFYDVEEDAENGGLVIVGQADDADGFLQLAGGRQPQEPQRRKLQPEALEHVADGFLAVLDAGSGPDDPLWQQLARLVAEILPGTGHVLSAREAYVAFQAAAAAMEDGDWEEALLKGGEALLDLAGAVPAIGDLMRLGKGAVKVANLLLRLGRRIDVEPRVLAMAAAGGAGKGRGVFEELPGVGRGQAQKGPNERFVLPENQKSITVLEGATTPIWKSFPETGTRLYRVPGEPVADRVLARGYPLGFRSSGHYKSFIQPVQEKVRELDPDAVIAIKGSAVTGQGFDKVKGTYTNGFFDSGVEASDYDIAIVSSKLFKLVEKEGIKVYREAGNTRVMNSETLKVVGLQEEFEHMKRIAGGRDVSLVIYESLDGLQAKGTMMTLGRELGEIQ